MSSSTIIYDRNYSKRLEDSFWDVVGGVVLIVASVIFIWVVEKAAVRFTLIFNRCFEACRVIQDTSFVNSLFQNRPVLMRGVTSCEGKVCEDPDTGFMSFEAPYVVRLKRTCEMFQWVRHERKEEKRTIVTFTQEWRECDQGDYASEGHPNPIRDPPLQSKCFNNTAKLGAFTLTNEQIDKMNLFKLCAIPRIPQKTLAAYAHTVPIVERGMKSHHGHDGNNDLKHDNECYNEVFEHTRQDPSDYMVFRGRFLQPGIGTVRVSYEYIQERDPITVVGVQTRSTFRPFFESDAHKVNSAGAAGSGAGSGGLFGGSAPDDRDPFTMESGGAGGSPLDDYTVPEPGCGGMCGCLEEMAGVGVGDRVLLVEERHVDLKSIFADEKEKFAKRLWMARTGGVVALMLGIYLLFSPIAAILSFLPFVGGILRSSFFVVAVLLGFLLGTLVSSLAWMAYHPEYLVMGMVTGGAVLLLWGETAGAVAAGKVILLCSLVPVGMYIWGVVEHHRFSALQRELDEKARSVQAPPQYAVAAVGAPTAPLPVAEMIPATENTLLLTKK